MTASGSVRAWCATHPYWVVALILGLAALVVAGSAAYLWTISGSATHTAGERSGKFAVFLLLAFLAGVVGLTIGLGRIESHWVSWRLPTLETRMELCQKQRSQGSWAPQRLRMTHRDRQRSRSRTPVKDRG